MAGHVRIGVASVQGDVEEHRTATDRALTRLGRSGEVVSLRTADDAEHVDAAIIPGGESTTIGKLLERFGAARVLQRRVLDESLPILGTCAGAILLAKEGDEQVRATRTPLLALMDMAVDRNAFGRQRESFETRLALDGFDSAVPAVFIRAPGITRTWGSCQAIGSFDGRIVAARQGPLWALAFHPELTSDSRIHEAFLATV